MGSEELHRGHRSRRRACGIVVAVWRWARWVLAAIVAAATPSAAGAVPAGYTLAWSDEFDSLSLGEPGLGRNWSPYFTGWNVRWLEGNDDEALKAADFERLPAGGAVGDALRESGRWGSRARYLHEVTEGNLALRGYPVPSAWRKRAWNAPYVAGMISGQASYGQRYGYWETRVRLITVSRGHHLAIWLLPNDDSWPPEIDMLEVVGLDPGRYYMNAIGTPEEQLISFQPSQPSDYHVLGFLWNSQEMVWYFDGEEKKRIDNYVNDKDFYFLVSWEIGGKWAGDPDASTKWPAEVLIDYLRIYRPAQEGQLPRP